VFLLVPAHLGSPGQRAFKLVWVCVCVCVCYRHLCVSRCGTVDGAYGPVKNPWQYRFHHQADQRVLHSTSSLPSSSHVQRVTQQARDYHFSSHRSSSTDHVHEQADVDTDAEVLDWFITGGSSGGSAVAVATGVAFA